MRKLVLVLVLAFAFMLGTSGPALANIQAVYNGQDAAWAAQGYTAPAGTNQEHRVVKIDDRECDGNQARVYYYIEAHTQEYMLADTSGCNNGSASASFVNSGWAVTWIKACEMRSTGLACSGWLQIYSHAWT